MQTFHFKSADFRRLACSLLLSMVAFAGCEDTSDVSTGQAGDDQVTPTEFFAMAPERQQEVRSTKVYIPEGMGYSELPPNPGVWDTRMNRKSYEGDTDFFAWQMARTLFHFTHPQIMLEGIVFDMWSPDQKAILGTALHSERSPAVYIARSLPESIVDGWFADITDLLDDWPEARDHRITHALGTFNNRIYCLPDNSARWPAIAYRKDFFEEIGVTNEFGEPGPPSDWTWADFRRYSRMLTKDRDEDGKIDRWGFLAEEGRFDLLYFFCHGLRERLYVPDKSGEFVWRFFADSPELIEGIRQFRAMKAVDQSVLTAVYYTWATKEGEFASDKVAMAYITSGHPLEWALTKPYMFGGNIKTIDVLGMAPIPRATPVGNDEKGYLHREPAANVFGFNPLYSETQLKAAIDWFRSWNAGYGQMLYLTSMKERNAAWGRPNPMPQHDLTRIYKNELPIPMDEGKEVFPDDWVHTYDVYQQLAIPPKPQMFGLLQPVQFYDALNNMYSDLLFTDVPIDRETGKIDEARELEIIRSIIQSHEAKINARCMNQRIESEEQLAEIRDKMKQYYTAWAEFGREHMPPDAGQALIQFIENHCVCWD
jgi:hypothetical protein